MFGKLSVLKMSDTYICHCILSTHCHVPIWLNIFNICICLDMSNCAGSNTGCFFEGWLADVKQGGLVVLVENSIFPSNLIRKSNDVISEP